MSVWEKLQNLDPRWFYYILLIVISIPIVKPWGLPIKIGSQSEAFHEAIEALNPNEVIFVVAGYRTDSIVEMDPQLAVLFRRALEIDVKVVVWGAVDEGPMVAQRVIEPIAEEMGAVYGVHWINLGYKPISDALLQKMIDDFPQAMAYTEMGGGRLDSYEITRDIRTVTQFDLIVCLTNVTPSPAQSILKMITIPKSVPLAVGTTAMCLPEEMPYYSSGHYIGLLGGLRGAAEYELLTGIAGSAIAAMDAQSAAHFLVIILIILGNLGYFFSKKEAKSR